MSFARVMSFQADISGSHLINIDIDNHGIEKGVSIVGLPDKAVNESKDRVLSALRNIHNKEINNGIHDVIISLAPAELPKHGPYFDLAIALGILQTIGVIKKDNIRRAFIGELGLDGSVRSVRGVISIAHSAMQNGIEELFVPRENVREAALISNIKIIPISSLNEAVRLLQNTSQIESTPKTEYIPDDNHGTSYLSIKGQETAKRGLMIAAAGGHNIAFFGPPGTGKTLLARSLIELLPPLNEDQMVETTMLHSLLGILNNDYISTPPFRSPHHTASVASIIGGGPNIRPGEIALANNGVLFMDEFPEFQSAIIESLREPLEDGRIRIARAKGTAQFKTRFILAIAMNPCPCGFMGDPKRECTCTQSRIENYRRKLSGPIVDRIDMWISVPRITHEELMDNKINDVSELNQIRHKVLNARNNSYDRNGTNKLNAHLSSREIGEHAPLNEACKKLLAYSSEKLLLSPRAIHRTIRLARTIADLDNSELINERHVSEALSYRPKM